MNKVFSGIAARGKTTKGWCYVLKLHLIINRGGGDDRKQLELMVKNLFGQSIWRWWTSLKNYFNNF